MPYGDFGFDHLSKFVGRKVLVSKTSDDATVWDRETKEVVAVDEQVENLRRHAKHRVVVDQVGECAVLSCLRCREVLGFAAPDQVAV